MLLNAMRRLPADDTVNTDIADNIQAFAGAGVNASSRYRAVTADLHAGRSGPGGGAGWQAASPATGASMLVVAEAGVDRVTLLLDERTRTCVYRVAQEALSSISAAFPEQTHRVIIRQPE